MYPKLDTLSWDTYRCRINFLTQTCRKDSNMQGKKCNANATSVHSNCEPPIYESLALGNYWSSRHGRHGRQGKPWILENIQCVRPTLGSGGKIPSVFFLRFWTHFWTTANSAHISSRLSHGLAKGLAGSRCTVRTSPLENCTNTDSCLPPLSA